MRRFAILLMVVLVGTALFPLTVALALVQEQPERRYGKEDVAEEVRALIFEKTRKENEELRKELDRLTAALEQLKAKQLEAAEERLDKGAPTDAEAIQQAEASQDQLQKAIEQRRFEQFQKAMEQLQLEVQQLQSQREKLEADLSRVAQQEYRKAVEASNLRTDITDIRTTDLLLALSKASAESASDAKKAYHDALSQYKLTARQQELEDAMLSKGDAGLIAILRFEKASVYRNLRMYDPAAQELRKIIEQNLDERVTEAARWSLVDVFQRQREKEAAIAELEKILTTTHDARKKRDALYGIINVLGDDAESKVSAIERLIRQLQGEQPAVSVPKEVPVLPTGAIQPPSIPEVPGPPAVTLESLSLPGEVAPVAPAVELPAAGALPTQPEATAPVGQSGPGF